MSERLKRIESLAWSNHHLLMLLQTEVLKMSQQVDDLVAQVAAQRTVIDSTKTLLVQLFDLVQAGITSGDLTKVQQVLDDLRAQDQELADAVSANTPPTP